MLFGYFIALFGKQRLFFCSIFIAGVRSWTEDSYLKEAMRACICGVLECVVMTTNVTFKRKIFSVKTNLE